MKNILAKSNSTKLWICCGVALLMVFSSLQAFADCPAINAVNGRPTTTVANVHTTTDGSGTVTYYVDTTSQLAGTGLVEYCVYTSSDAGTFVFDQPSAFAADYPGWQKSPNHFTNGSTNFSFARSTGPALIPFDGNSYDVGQATFASAPATVVIMLHISDLAECTNLYPNAPGLTCFAMPGEQPPPPPKPSHWPLEGRKFYDLNADGVRQPGEPLINGWKIHAIGDNPMLDPSVLEPNYPDANGTPNTYYSTFVYTGNANVDDSNPPVTLPPGSFVLAQLTVGGTYGTCEVSPANNWVATTVRPTHSLGGTNWESEIFCPRHIQANETDNATANDNVCYSTTNSFSLALDLSNLTFVTSGGTGPFVNIAPGRGPVDFGNVCTGAGGGLTLGFWSNKNGQNLETAADFTLLTGLNLRNANGTDRDFTGTLSANKTALNSWLLSASATNMAYMLSAQLTAMELNVAHNKVSGSALVYAGSAPAGCTVTGLSGTGFIAISDLMTDANASLGLHPITTASGIDRSCQEFMKTTLDKANNNLNFLQTDPAACGLVADKDGSGNPLGTFTASYTNPNADCSQPQLQNTLNGIAAGVGPIPQP